MRAPSILLAGVLTASAYTYFFGSGSLSSSINVPRLIKLFKHAERTFWLKLATRGMHSRAVKHTGKPLKILCLHGGGETAAQMDRRLARMKQYLGPLVDLVTVDAPPPPGVPSAVWRTDGSGTQPPKRKPGHAWFSHWSRSASDWDARWAAVLSGLESTIATQGPFDGLLGFSNGGACASALLCATPHGTFRFVVIVDGHAPAGKGDEGNSTMALLERRRPIDTPALFTIGETSQFKGMCEGLRSYFEAPETRYHPQGHILPEDEASLEQIADFLLRQVVAE
jgi:hypothetical protein